MPLIINPFWSAAPAPPIVGALRWYDAAFYSLADGTAITPAMPWDDQSANDSDATSVTGEEPSFRTNIFGTLPAIRFAYPDRFLLDSGILLSDFTIICIAKVSSDSVWLSLSTDNRQVRIKRSEANVFSFYDGASEHVSGALTNPASDARMGTWRRDFGTTVVDWFENATNIPGAAAAVNTMGIDTIGAQVGAPAINMDIGEIVIFDTYKTDLEIQDLYNNYFKPKFGLP